MELLTCFQMEIQTQLTRIGLLEWEVLYWGCCHGRRAEGCGSGGGYLLRCLTRTSPPETLWFLRFSFALHNPHSAGNKLLAVRRAIWSSNEQLCSLWNCGTITLFYCHLDDDFVSTALKQNLCEAAAAPLPYVVNTIVQEGSESLMF